MKTFSADSKKIMTRKKNALPISKRRQLRRIKIKNVHPKSCVEMIF
jgi:hypothetical protein